jgi:hypothetical protein
LRSQRRPEALDHAHPTIERRRAADKRIATVTEQRPLYRHWACRRHVLLAAAQRATVQHALDLRMRFTEACSDTAISVPS